MDTDTRTYIGSHLRPVASVLENSDVEKLGGLIASIDDRFIADVRTHSARQNVSVLWESKSTMSSCITINIVLWQC